MPSHRDRRNNADQRQKDRAPAGSVYRLFRVLIGSHRGFSPAIDPYPSETGGIRITDQCYL